MTAVRNECSLTDCSYLEMIADRFKLQKCQQTTDNYHSSLSSFCCHTLTEHPYVESFCEDCSQYIISSNRITFKLWNAIFIRRQDIRDVLQMGFEELATRIQIVVIKAGSVVVVCWFPQNLEKLLVRISQKTLIQLTEMGVVMSNCWLD